MAENAYKWAQPEAQAQPQAGAQTAEQQPQNGYRWKQTDAERLKARLAELAAQIRELKRRKSENDFAASMMAEGDNSAFQTLMSSRRAAEDAAAAKAENDRAAKTAERENAEAAIDEYVKQFRELYTGFRRMSPDEQQRARISGEYLRKKAETLAAKYGIDLPDFDGIASPQTQGPSLDEMLIEVKRKADAGELTDADVQAFYTSLAGMNGDFSTYEDAKKTVGGYETVEKRKKREDSSKRAKARERKRNEILLKYRKAETAGDYDAMDDAIDEWQKAGFSGRPQ